MKLFTLISLLIIFFFSCKDSTESEIEDKHILGYALSFDGINGFLDLPRLAFNDLPMGSVELWIKAHERDRDFFYKETYNAGTISCLRINPDGTIQGSHENFTDSHDVVSNASLVSNNWYHIGWTWDGTNQKIYINGLLDSSQSCTDGVANHLGDWVRLGRC